MVRRFVQFSSIFIFFPTMLLFAQYGNVSAQRVGLLNGNNFHSLFTNCGVIAQPSNLTPRGTWRGNSNGYIGDMSFLIGVELPLKDYTGDGKVDTIHSVIITNVDRPGGGKSGPGGKDYTFEPIPGYFNPGNTSSVNGIALSDQPDTWPTTWPDHPEWGAGVWNGLNGPNTFVGKQEAYFVMDDQNDDSKYNQYGFRPSTVDTLRHGMGLRVNVRYVQFNNPLYKDILFRIYDIKNEGTYNYQKVVFGNLTGTYIGGAGDEYNDDASLFYPREKAVVSIDVEPGTGQPFVHPSANPNWKGRVGAFSESIISSPDNGGIAGFDYFVPADYTVMSNDEAMWNSIIPGKTQFPASVTYDADSIPHASHGEDGDYLFGSGYFPLNAGETKRIVTAVAFGYSIAETLQKQKMAEALYNAGFDTSVAANSVKLSNLLYHQKLSGTLPIQWKTAQTGGTVEIWFSPDAGTTWKNVVRNTPNTGSFNWNTTTEGNCSFGLIRIYSKNSNGTINGFAESHYFSIVNGTAASQPFVKILNQDLDTTNAVAANLYPVQLLIGNVNDSPLQLKISAMAFGDNAYQLYETQEIKADSSATSLPLNLAIFPNSTSLKIRFELTDGSSSSIDETPAFAKMNDRQNIPSQNIRLDAKKASTSVQIRQLDPKALTGDDYVITFNDTASLTQKYFSVYDRTKSKYVLQNAMLIPYTESAGFDGLALYAEDFQTHLDTSSHWAISSPDNLTYQMIRYVDKQNGIIGNLPPVDYAIVFSDKYSDSSNTFTSLLKYATPGIHNINFKIFDITDRANIQRIKFALVENTAALQDTLSPGDALVLSNSAGSFIGGMIHFINSTSTIVPPAGDTLFLYTQKGLSVFDTILVTGKISDVKYGHSGSIASYSLSQNYPNPFNPSTIIRYELPKAGKVTLKVYNIIGKEVATLVQGEQAAGTHSLVFNAEHLSSGVYFYTLNAGSYIQTRKMLLIK